MGRSTPSQSGMTYDHLTVNLGMASSMLCLLDSPANPMPSAAIKEGSKMNGTSGPIPVESLAKYDHDTSSWRMSLPLFNTWEEYCPETWPVSAMTVGGQLYPLVPQVPHTFGSDGGAWPTPTANTRPNEGNVRLLRKQVLEGDLTEAEATSMLNGKSPFSAQGVIPAMPTQNDLNDAVDLKEGPDNGGRLNPDWVEWLMGWPVGWTSLDPLPEGTMEAWETSVKAGTYWDTDPADTGDVPRLTEKKENRASRLKAIGNGQVPAQILLAWEVLG
ncbi:MAG: hypothetical protein ABGY10_03720 [bacterium]